MLRRIRNLLCRWFKLPTQDEVDRLRATLDEMDLGLSRVKARFRASEEARTWLQSQLVQIRVGQSKFSRAGWEVMCFIPEEALKQLRHPGHNQARIDGLVLQVTRELVRLAIAGIVRVDAQGKVSALVFEPLNMNEKPRAPRFVQALFDKDGEFKLSEKCWDQRSEEQRVKSAAGMPGFGV